MSEGSGGKANRLFRRIHMKTSKNRWMDWCVIALLLLTLQGCDVEELFKDEPLPEDKKSYAGNWQNSNTTLKISMNGEVNYKKEEGRTSVSIEGPIKEFIKNDFVVGFWIISTTFEVQQPPFQEGERWAMVVDGSKLYKVN